MAVDWTVTSNRGTLAHMANLTAVRPPLEEKSIRLGAAPGLLIYHDSPGRAAKRGTILFYHGLGVDKRAHLFEMSRLAGAGYLVIGIDAVGHGERRYPDYEERFTPEKSHDSYYEVVIQTVREVPGLIDELKKRELADGRGVGMAGISMGGFICYAAVLEDERVKVITPVIASPYFRDIPEISPHLHPDRFFPAAVFSQNAGADTIVNPAFARDFHAALEKHYRQNPERLKHVEYPGVEHVMPPSDWSRVVSGMLEWFKRFMPPAVKENQG